MGTTGSMSQWRLLSSILIFGSILICFAYLGASPSVDAQEYRWTDYFGSHNGAKPWARTVRQPGGNPGGAVPVSDMLPSHLDSRHTDPEKAERDRRRAERQRRKGQYDPEASVVKVETELKQLFPTQAAVLNLGGPGKRRRIGAVEMYIEALEVDNAADWKADVRERVARLARLDHSETNLYWQLGNEVNAAWSNHPTVDGGIHDQASIPLYVEYFVAPAVEAIEAASMDVYDEPGRIKIILGSIGGYANPLGQDYLNALLKYKIEGTMAPSLSGRTVAELVDFLSQHYLVSKPHIAWEKVLDDVNDTWIGQYKIKGIWATEELGSKRANAGAGGAIALQLISRYLHWWGTNDISPAESRAFFYGPQLGPEGTRGSEALAELHNFLGDAVLTEFKPAVSISGDLEVYGFKSPESKTVIFVSPVSDAGGTLLATNMPQAKLVKYSDQGRQEIPLGNDLQLGRGEAAMLLVTE